MKAAAVAVMLLWTAPLFGQYPGAPARDVKDAVRMLQEMQRLIEPAIDAVRDEAAVLGALAKAAEQLKDAQPASSFDDAGKVITRFLDQRNANDPLPRELARSIREAQRILDLNKPILNVAAAREQLHHDVIHPLQREAMRNAGDLQQLTQQLQFIQMRMVAQPLAEILGSTAYASTDPPK